MSAPALHEIGAAAVEGGMRLGRFAHVNPKHGSNIHRALMAQFSLPGDLINFTWIELPFAQGSDFHPFLLPHELFSAIKKSRPELFRTSILPVGTDLSAFWSSLRARRHPFVIHHPDLGDTSVLVPLGVHGDAGPYNTHSGVMAICWNRILGSGPTVSKRFVITCLDKKHYTVPAVMAKVWSIVAWSLNALQAGVEPQTDIDGRPPPEAGKPLGAGLRCAVCQIRGDWELFNSQLGVPHWNAKEDVLAVPRHQQRRPCVD